MAENNINKIVFCTKYIVAYNNNPNSIYFFVNIASTKSFINCKPKGI